MATPVDPHRIAAFIASAEDDSRTKRGRPLDRDELAQLLRWYPDCTREPSQDPDGMIKFEHSPVDLSVPANDDGNWDGKQSRSEGPGHPEAVGASGHEKHRSGPPDTAAC